MSLVSFRGSYSNLFKQPSKEIKVEKDELPDVQEIKSTGSNSGTEIKNVWTAEELNKNPFKEQLLSWCFKKAPEVEEDKLSLDTILYSSGSTGEEGEEAGTLKNNYLKMSVEK
jgi:hypothetical protein